MVDQNIVHGRIEKIRACLTRLRELAGTSEEAFLQDEDSCALAERHLQVAIQSVIDIGHHVVADMDLGLPEDYKGLECERQKRLPDEKGRRVTCP